MAETKPIAAYTSNWLKLGLGSDKPLIWSLDKHPGTWSEAHYDIHAGLELTIILEGKVKRWIRDYGKTLGPGDVWLSNVFEPHAFQATEPPVTLLCIIILPYLIAAPGTSLGPPVDFIHPFRVPPEFRPMTGNSQIVKDRCCEYARQIAAIGKDDLYAPNEVVHLTMSLLIELIRGWKPPESYPKASHDMGKLAPALELVHDGVERVPADIAAAECNLSRVHFSRSFKEMMGISYHEYEKQYRLNLAARAMLQDDYKLEYLAKKFGFTDSSHLNRLFHKYFGISPLNYIEKNRDTSV